MTAGMKGAARVKVWEQVTTIVGSAAAGVFVSAIAVAEGGGHPAGMYWILGVLLLLFVVCLLATRRVIRVNTGGTSSTATPAAAGRIPWWIVLGVALIVGLSTFWGMSWLYREPACEDLLQAWELPTDLCHRQQQLKSLTLSGPIDQVSWLDADLRELNLTETRVRSLEGIPEGVHSLTIRGTPLRSLYGLPASVHCLDAGLTGICDFSRLPPNLEYLNLEGTTLRQGETLPDSVTNLTILATEFERLAWPPRNLTTLRLIGVSDVDSIEVPNSVTALTLNDEARPRAALRKDLVPRKLVSLRMTGLDLLDRSFLPNSLDALYVRKGTLQISEFPSVTNLGLELVDEVGNPAVTKDKAQEGSLLSRLPPVQTLVLDDVSFSHIRELPSSVTNLTVPWPGDRKLRNLPPNLTDLDLTHSKLKRLDKLPNGVKRLTLTGSSVENLGDLSESSLEKLTFRFCGNPEFGRLPSSLVTLDLHGCDIDQLPALQGGLQRLNIASTRISSLQAIPKSVVELNICNTGISDLRGLPPGLQTLTITRGKITSLEDLPETVTDLRFCEPGV